MFKVKAAPGNELSTELGYRFLPVRLFGLHHLISTERFAVAGPNYAQNSQ